MSYYFYTETAFHHEGDLDYIKQLIIASKEAGANGVKFQVLMDIDNLTASTHVLYDKLTTCIFTFEEWVEIFLFCIENGLDVIMMPLDEGAFKLLEVPNISVKYMDLHSVSFYDNKILELIKRSEIPLIIGVGGRSIEEIREKYNYFGTQFEIVMVGFQSYPSKLEDIKLERIRAYQKVFPKMKIGYADHSGFAEEMAIKSNEFAYLLGATFFEKHITVSEGEERLDFQSALGHDKVKQLVDKLNYLDQEVFSHPDQSLFEIKEPELSYRNRQKVAVAKFDLMSGDVINESNVTFKMIDSGIGEQSINQLLGKKLKKDVAKDHVLLIQHIEEF